jgi:hypothetical protein
MMLLEEMSSSQGNQNTLVTERKATPHYFLPQTLRNWPWQRNISPHCRSCKTESATWFESFKPTPKVQAAFNKGDYSLLAALCFPRSSHCVPFFLDPFVAC